MKKGIFWLAIILESSILILSSATNSNCLFSPSAARRYMLEARIRDTEFGLKQLESNIIRLKSVAQRYDQYSPGAHQSRQAELGRQAILNIVQRLVVYKTKLQLLLFRDQLPVHAKLSRHKKEETIDYGQKLQAIKISLKSVNSEINKMHSLFSLEEASKQSKQAELYRERAKLLIEISEIKAGILPPILPPSQKFPPSPDTNNIKKNIENNIRSNFRLMG